MRTREEIEIAQLEGFKIVFTTQCLILEVLLDCRDLLIKLNKEND